MNIVDIIKSFEKGYNNKNNTDYRFICNITEEESSFSPSLTKFSVVIYVVKKKIPIRLITVNNTLNISNMKMNKDYYKNNILGSQLLEYIFEEFDTIDKIIKEDV